MTLRDNLADFVEDTFGTRRPEALMQADRIMEIFDAAMANCMKEKPQVNVPCECGLPMAQIAPGLWECPVCDRDD